MKTLITILLFTFCINATAQIIYTAAGNGVQGYSGDGGPATAAELNTPSDIVTDMTGNVYIAEHDNHRIRKVSATGIISTIAGNGTSGYSGDGGLASSAQISNPNGITIDASGNIYFSQGDYDCVRKIDINGIITTVAGNGIAGYSGNGGPATSAKVSYPAAVKVDMYGNIFIAEYGNNVIRKVDAATGIITTVAGTGNNGYNGDGIQATTADLKNPFGIALDAAGNIYIADTWNYRIRKVNNNGIISTVAGNGVPVYNGDGGQATSASLSSPIYVTVDANDNLYLSDYSSHRVRKVSANGIINTIAGNGTAGYSGDGGPAFMAELRHPCGIAIDATGKIVIADEGNHCIRTLCTSNVLSINASTTSVCIGESVTLTANGANTYTWSTNQTGASISVTPNISVLYAVYATDNYGCENNSSIVIYVSACVGLKELENDKMSFYPNPASDILNIELVSSSEVENLTISDVLGKEIINHKIENNSFGLNLSELKSGIYFLKAGNNIQKFVKE